MSDTQWYIEREGVEYGPCTWDGLQALARQGTLRPTDLVRREGDTYFVPAHQARCDAPANPEGAAGQPAAQWRPGTARKLISELAGPAPKAEPAAAEAVVPDALERAVAEDVQLTLADAIDSPLTAVATKPAEPVEAAKVIEPVVAVARTEAVATPMPAPAVVPAPSAAEPVRVESSILEAAATKVVAAKVVAPKVAIKTTLPAQQIVEIELDETLAPATPREPMQVNFTGPAILALVCAVGGLFWFGLLLGFVSVVLAVRSLRAMGRNGALAPRGVAMAALMLGAADVIVLVSALAAHGRLTPFFWN